MLKFFLDFIIRPELTPDEQQLIATLNADTSMEAIGNGTLIREISSVTENEEFKQKSERFAELVTH